MARPLRVVVVTRGRYGVRVLGQLWDEQAALVEAARRPVDICGVEALGEGLDREVLRWALGMIDRMRPDVLVEALGEPGAGVTLAAHALRAEVDVVTASPRLPAAAGPALHDLAARGGVRFAAVNAAGPDRALLRALTLMLRRPEPAGGTLLCCW